MKRVLVLVLLAVLVMSMSSFAADGGKKMPMAAGFMAGVSLGNATGSDAAAVTGETKKMRLGFGFGGFFAFSPANSITIQPEILYLQKGVKYEEDAGGKTTIKLDYLEVPVLVKFTPVMENSKIAPTLFAGPYLGFNLGAKVKAEGFADPLENGEVDYKDHIKSTDFGLTFGGGLGYKMTKGELFFDARYDLGLSKVAKTLADGTQPNTKSSAILVMVGYKFDI